MPAWVSVVVFSVLFVLLVVSKLLVKCEEDKQRTAMTVEKYVDTVYEYLRTKKDDKLKLFVGRHLRFFVLHKDEISTELQARMEKSNKEGPN